MGDFDYTSPAELFAGKGRGAARGRPMTYKRFPTSAEAVTYAVAMRDTVTLAGAVLVVGEDRYEGCARSIETATRSGLALGVDLHQSAQTHPAQS